MTSSECLVPNTLFIGVPSTTIPRRAAFKPYPISECWNLLAGLRGPAHPDPLLHQACHALRMTLWRWKDNQPALESSSAPASVSRDVERSYLVAQLQLYAH